METGSIIEIIVTALFGGGIVTFVTLRDKKTEAMLSNMEKVIEELRILAGGYKEEVITLKGELHSKGVYIDELHRKESALYEKLDKANSRAAVFKILKCTKVGCDRRIPPFGSGSVDIIKQVNEGRLGDAEDGQGEDNTRTA
jgi:hypothetical protein